jgi:hypothetical protein
MNAHPAGSVGRGRHSIMLPCRPRSKSQNELVRTSRPKVHEGVLVELYPAL